MTKNITKELKKISVDTNHHYLGGYYPLIDLVCVELNKLIEGETVLAFQDNDVWESVVRFDPHLPEEYRWYIELGEDVSPVLNDGEYQWKLVGQWEGFISGREHGIRMEWKGEELLNNFYKQVYHMKKLVNIHNCQLNG